METGHSLEKTARRTHCRALPSDDHPSITGTSRGQLPQDDSSAHTHGWAVVYIGADDL
jgi:hypothetical protein